MYALRERRQHVTQEDFEFAVAKVRVFYSSFVRTLADGCAIGVEEEPRGEHVGEQAVLIVDVSFTRFVLTSVLVCCD